jgi:mevalonate kinase
MGITESNAPGKLILCGEHAVVYGRPAIALPLDGICARVQIEDTSPGSGFHFCAPDLDREWIVDKNSSDPLGELLFATLRYVDLWVDDLKITITSDIPIASGMGSGAAVSTALVRALMSHLGTPLPPGDVSTLVYACETRYHGTPSGIDNTVIAFEQPIWFVRKPADTRAIRFSECQTLRPVMESLHIAAPLTIVLGDTGIRSKTRLPVGEVRKQWEQEPKRYEDIFDQVGMVVSHVRDKLAEGNIQALGPLLNSNQELLEKMGVSSPELEQLIAAARQAGAIAAKLSGAGWGGIMFALTDDANSQRIAHAIKQSGASRVLITTVAQTTTEPK